MIKNHKWKAIISSAVILLPIVFGLVMWNRLPDTMVSHWGADGVADGTAPKAWIVFGMPLLLLAIQWLMLLLASVLKDKKPQNSKIVAVEYALIPLLSLVVHVFIYSIALEKEWNLFALMSVFLGAVFLYIGNYLPKTTRNRTTGIKLTWTLGNEENWNKTHRLGGKLWFVGGLVMVASALLPVKGAVAVMIAVIIICAAVPTVYSYRIYKKHKAEGVVYERAFDAKSDKIAIGITTVFVPLILLGTTVLMVTGDVDVRFTDADFRIVASYMEDVTIAYEDLDAVEYRESFDIGSREMGFGSPRLSTGTFKNKEFGRYTLYAYTQGKGAVVLKKGDSILVIVAKTREENKAIYDTLTEKIPG